MFYVFYETIKNILTIINGSPDNFVTSYIQNRTIKETKATENKNKLVKKPRTEIEFTYLNKTFEKTYWLASLIEFPTLLIVKAVVNALI